MKLCKYSTIMLGSFLKHRTRRNRAPTGPPIAPSFEEDGPQRFCLSFRVDIHVMLTTHDVFYGHQPLMMMINHCLFSQDQPWLSGSNIAILRFLRKTLGCDQKNLCSSSVRCFGFPRIFGPCGSNMGGYQFGTREITVNRH